MCEKHYQMYHTVKNFGGKKVWQNSVFETLAKKTLVNPRLARIFSVQQL